MDQPEHAPDYLRASSRARKRLVLGERWLDYYYRIDEDPAVTA